MDYKTKYIKYKTKYLNEKKNQYGGYILAPYPIGMPPFNPIGMPPFNSVISPYVYPYYYPNTTYESEVNDLVQRILNIVDKNDSPKSKAKLAKIIELLKDNTKVNEDYKNNNIQNIIARIYRNQIEFIIKTKNSVQYTIRYPRTNDLIQKVKNIMTTQ